MRQTAERMKRMNWISTKERLPKDHEEVLVYRFDESFDIADRIPLSETCAYWCCSDGVWSDSEITHWMPLPEPPKEET